MAGRIALVGSGEYLPVLTDVEDWLFADNPRVYVQLATASAPEGADRLGYWHDLGRQAADRLDAEQVVIDIRTRADAEDERWVPLIERAGLIYLSGGNPSFLTESLKGTPAWDAIRRTWERGAGLAGCSAGAMAMGGTVQHFRYPGKDPLTGLAVVPDVRVFPHFDRYTRWLPDLALRPFASRGGTMLGIDEDTALVAEDPGHEGPWTFRVEGRQNAYVIRRDDVHRIDTMIDLEVDS
jgi:cyanophycinase-like exopeptidase